MLGFSNGLLTTNAFTIASTNIDTSNAGDLVGNIMVFSLVLGLCMGALSGFLWLL